MLKEIDRVEFHRFLDTLINRVGQVGNPTC